MFELEDIGKNVWIKNKRFGTLYNAEIVDVRDDGGSIVKVEDRARLLLAPDMLVDLEHDSREWELWAKRF